MMIRMALRSIMSRGTAVMISYYSYCSLTLLPSLAPGKFNVHYILLFSSSSPYLLLFCCVGAHCSPGGAGHPDNQEGGLRRCEWG